MSILSGKTIFMVEDNPGNAAIIRTILRQAGARVPYDHRGDITLTRMIQNLPLDMILMDLMLPGASGYDIFDAIRNQPKLKDIPIVAVSASDPDVEIPRAKKLGFSSFISKPIDRRTFPENLSSIMAGEKIWGG